MYYSEFIDDFLTNIRKVAEINSLAKSVENDKNLETLDILHRLELVDDKYHDMAKLSKTLKKIRQERREAKDKVLITEPIAAWIEDNRQTINALERLLGEVRKAEKSTEGRFYMDKTDIIKEIFGENEEDKSNSEEL